MSGTVTINGKTPVTAGSKGVAIATLPNVCKMPAPPPAPFSPAVLPSVGKSDIKPQGYTTRVKVEGFEVAVQGSSFGSTGDVASRATGGGLVSSSTEGATKIIGPGSLNVKYEGKRVHLLGDPTLNNCGPSGAPANAATMQGITQNPGKKAIERATRATIVDELDDQNEAEAENMACLGGKVSLQLVPRGGVSLTDVRWTISSHGNVIRSFTMDDRETKLDPIVDTDQCALAFYWTKAGKFTVTAQARANGSFWQRQLIYRVHAPRVDCFSASVDQVKIGMIDHPIVGRRVPALTFGGTDAKPGLLIEARVRAPPGGESKFGITQLMTIDRSTEYQSNIDHKSSEGVYVLDESALYGVAESVETEPEDFIGCAGEDVATFVHEDSPARVLSRQPVRGKIMRRVSVNEKFISYLVYQPEGGIWLAIAKMHWSWAGTATWIPLAGPELYPRSFSPGGDEEGFWALSGARWTTSPVSELKVEFPSWSNNRDRFM